MEKTRETIEGIVIAHEKFGIKHITNIKSKNTAFHFPIFYNPVQRKYREGITNREMCDDIGIDYAACMDDTKPMTKSQGIKFELADGRACNVSGMSKKARDKRFEHVIRVEVE